MMINCCLLRITFWVIHSSISAFIAAISVLLSVLEHFSALLFELASDLYGVSPRASFPTEKSAILILGAHEGPPIQSLSLPRELTSLYTQVWEETRRSRFLSWAIPSLLYVQIDKTSLGPLGTSLR